MDVVLVKQFEEFLKSMEIKSKETKQKKRTKRSVAFTLSDGEARKFKSYTNDAIAYICIKIPALLLISLTIFFTFQLKKFALEFLKVIYPGASGSPVDMAKMMALPEIEPDSLISGIFLIK